MMHATETSPSVLILGGAETEVVDAALEGLDVTIGRIRDRDEFGRTQRRADLVLLERARLEGPGTVREWLDTEILDAMSPLLLLAPMPVEPSEYRNWLNAGVWEVVRLPVDPHLLALRLRNLLGGPSLPGRRSSLGPQGPYTWASMVRATQETLALARRLERPVSCVAVALDHRPEPNEHPSPRLMHRLGVAAQEWVRDADIVGLSEHDVLLAILPDTSADEAEILGPRLVAALQRSLKRAGVAAGFRISTLEASADPSQSAATLLLAAARQVG